MYEQNTITNTRACPHLQDEEIVDFLLHKLPSEKETQILEHLDSCTICADDMAHLTKTVQAWSTGGLGRVAAKVISKIEASSEIPHRYSSGGGKTNMETNDVTLETTERTFDLAKQQVIKSWANQQKDSDSSRKRTVAIWACRYFKLNGASGVYFDAGSSCLNVWEELAHQIVSEGQPSQIHVLTNNLMILNNFANDPSPLLHGAKMASIGEFFDVLHQAFFGPAIAKRLRSGEFRPEVIYIGTNGISFSEDGSILFGFHADEPEREVKQLLFANPCKAKARVILATAKKIGNPGGTVFDILKMPELDCKTPLFLLTTPPTDGEGEAYEEALRIFKTENMQKAIRDRGLNFQWIEIHGPEPNQGNNITAMVESDRRLCGDALGRVV